MSAGANSYKTATKGDRRDTRSTETAYNKRETTMSRRKTILA